MNNIETKDILIVGGGPVGVYSMTCAKMLGLSGLLIESNDKLGGQPQELYENKNIYDIPGTIEVTGGNFAKQLIEQTKNAKNDKFEHFTNTFIDHIENINDLVKVKFSNDMIYLFKSILITTGNGLFNPVKADIREENIENLHYKVNSESIFKNKKNIILGGGDSAVDWANHFSQNSQNTIIIRRNEFRAKSIGVNLLNKNNVKVLKNLVLDSYVLKDKKLVELKFKDTSKDNEIISFTDFDNLLVQYGSKISIGNNKLWNISLTKFGKILINQKSETSQANIYAAGNCAGYDGKYYNLTTGFGEAITAIYNISKIIYGDKYHPGYLHN